MGVALGSRKTDPITSVLADEEFTNSGGKDLHERLIIKALKELPSSTARELGSKVGLSNVQVLRRMAELERKEMVVRHEPRKCLISNRLTLTWSADPRPAITLAPFFDDEE